MADKNFEPEIQPETPFPGEPIILPTQTQPSTDGNYNPTTTKEKTFPKKRTAVELLSTALNTRSKKILQEFALQDSGGLKIGDFKQGLSGDLRLTPNGMTARNKSGITTLAVDGDTGDAVFKGEVQAGSLITGEVVVGNNRVIIDVDDAGEPTIIVNDGTNDRVIIGFQSGGF